MADERLRKVERDATLTAPVARARLWVELIRSGRLTAEELALAAHVGDEAACLATGAAPAAGALRSRCGELGRWGALPCAQAAVVACEELIRLAASESVRSAALRASVESLRAWCSCPCAEHAQDASRVVDALPWSDALDGDADPWREWLVFQCLAAVTEGVRILSAVAPGDAVASVVTLAVSAMTTRRWRSTDRPLDELDLLQREVEDHLWRRVAAGVVQDLERRRP